MAAVWGLLFFYLVRSLPRIAITEIRGLTNAKVDLQKIDFKFNGSVLINGLMVRPDQTMDEGRETRDDDAILKASTVYARFGLCSLLLLSPRLKEIRINDFVFDLRCDLDAGRWNIAALKLIVSKDGAGKMPLIHLNGGTLQYSKVSSGRSKILAAIPIDVRFRPAEDIVGGYSFDIATGEVAESGRSRLFGVWQPGKITVAGGISSGPRFAGTKAGIPAIEKAWVINVLNAEFSYDQSSNYSLILKAKDLLYAQDNIIESPGSEKLKFLADFGLLTAMQDFFSRYHPVGKVDLELESSGSFKQITQSALTGRVYCKDVSICDSKFPYTIENITGRLDFTEHNVILDNLTGVHGDVQVTINGWAGDFGPDQRYQIQIVSDNMDLNNDLYRALSIKQRELWKTFSPSGRAAIDYRFSRQSQTQRENIVTVVLRSAEAVYRGFCYPLKNVTGTILFDQDQDNIIVSDVVSHIDQGRIIFNGKVTDYSTDRPNYNLTIKANDVPIDSTLLRSLPANQGDFFNRFEISGLTDANAVVFSPVEEPGAVSFRAELALRNTSLRINNRLFQMSREKPLVLSDVSANVVLLPETTVIKDLTGRYDRSVVSLSGEMQLTEKTQPSYYYLTLNASRAQWSDDLIGLLPASIGKIVTQCQPEGELNLSGYLNKTAGQEQPDYKITIDCLGNNLNFKQFIYPLKDVTGRFTISNDMVTLDNVTAAPADATGSSAITINGQIALAGNDFGDGNFQLSASDISFEDRLAGVLPAGFVSFYQALSPSGRLDLELENVKIYNADKNEKYVDFAGLAKFKACNFNISGTQAEINAALKMEGLYKTNGGFVNGGLRLVADNLKIKDKSLTNLQADFHYNSSLRIWGASNMIADCYGGRVTGKVEFKESDSPVLADSQFSLQAGFDNIDLRRFLLGSKAAEAPDPSYSSGTMNGSLSLAAGIGAKSFSPIGRCRFMITDMQVGKLSLLAKLLYVLQIKEQRDFAFEQMVVDSYFKQNLLSFEKFDLSGEALAFSGTGWMDMQTENVGLTLTARGKRLSPIQSAASEPSFIQSLAEGLGGAVVRMEVTGNIYDPKVETKTLPVVEDSLKILGTPR